MRFWPQKFVSKDDSNIGNVLIKMRVVTAMQVCKAAELHEAQKARCSKCQTDCKAKPGPDLRLGAYMVDMGFIAAEDLEHALVLQKKMRNGGASEAMVEIIERYMDRRRRQPVLLAAE